MGQQRVTTMDELTDDEFAEVYNEAEKTMNGTVKLPDNEYGRFVKLNAKRFLDRFGPTNDKLILSGAIGRMRNLSNGMVKTNRKIRAIDINDQCQG